MKKLIPIFLVIVLLLLFLLFLAACNGGGGGGKSECKTLCIPTGGRFGETFTEIDYRCTETCKGKVMRTWTETRRK